MNNEQLSGRFLMSHDHIFTLKKLWQKDKNRLVKTIYRLPQNLGGKFQGLMERHDERQDVGCVF